MGDLKIHPLLDLLAPALETTYTLGQNVSIDESMSPFKGRLKYKQYIPNSLTHGGSRPMSWQTVDLGTRTV